MRATWALCLCVLALAAAAARAEPGTVEGYMFGDYYYVVSADDGDAKYPKKQNAFQFRRVYLTYNRNLSDDFAVRYRLEAKDAGFGSDDRMEPFVKHAYLRWRRAVGGADLYLGLSGTPTWAISEAAWGYRSIEKTVLALHEIGSSADLGVGMKGRAGPLTYHVMVGNGPGQKPEQDNGKKVYASFSMAPSEGLTAEVYGDYNMLPADANQMTLKAFLGLERADLRLGVEPFVRINQNAVAGDDQSISGVSLFGVVGLGRALDGFGRLDVVNDDGDDTTDMLVIAGVDREVGDDIHVMPNLYVDLPDGPDPNVQARLTVYYRM